jgi:hypothetical protein
MLISRHQNAGQNHNIKTAHNIKIHRTVILPVVLYGCGTWSLTVREEHKLRVFGNRVMRRISGPTRNEIIGGWK